MGLGNRWSLVIQPFLFLVAETKCGRLIVDLFESSFGAITYVLANDVVLYQVLYSWLVGGD